MKKFLFIISILLYLLTFVSCKKEPPISNKSTQIEDGPSTETKTTDEAPILPEKPSTVDDIIKMTDGFDLDYSLTGFSLDGILEEAQLLLSDDAGDDYQSSTAYLGDSVTLGLAFFKNHPSYLVIAKGSINPLDAVDKKLIELEDGTLVNFPTALSKTNAKRAVLTFGSNAISIMSEETFLKYYIKLIDAIKSKTPDCDIIIQSITPLATTCKLKKLTNELINRSNALLLTLSYAKDIKFLNSAPELKDQDGYMKIEYTSSDDGIHINEEGYKIWINSLRTHPITE